VSHADEVITDVDRRRVVACVRGDAFTVAWDYPGRTLLEVRILRSSERAAWSADEGPAEGQEVVYQGVTGAFRDEGLPTDCSYRYTVFARHPGGEWTRWTEHTVQTAPADGAGRSRRSAGSGPRRRIVPVLLAVGLLFAALGPAPAVVASAGEPEAGGSEGKGAEAAPAHLDAALAAAGSDAGVAAVLDGRGAEVESATPWGGTAEEPAGYTIQYRWAAAQAATLDGRWPLLRPASSSPAPPYEATQYRIRASDVTGLQVDVLLDGPRVIQVKPVDGETQFVLHEQTWPPLSRLPWLTVRPWVLAPLVVALAAAFIVRAWLRSRAWNRRLPSMTRYDRQLVFRVTVLLFLAAGVVWQFYEGWFAVTGPTLGGSWSAGALAALPLLLIPPGLFVAALVLEIGAGPHRGSWALIAVLSGAAAAYFLVAATIGVTMNLNLSYFILLSVLTLIAIPRAFSAGKMGWSRSASTRYG